MRTAGFLARRALVAVTLVLVLTAATFAIYFALPTDPGRLLLGGRQQVTEQQLETANRALGTDRPVVEQYVSYVGDLARGDLGISWLGAGLGGDGELEGTPVRPTLFAALRVTGSLVLGGALLLLLLSIPLGLISASRPNSMLDRTVLLLSLVAISTHPIVIGLVLRLFAAERSDLAPQSGYCPLVRGELDRDSTTLIGHLRRDDVCGGLADWAHHLVIPWVAFALFFAALYLRMIRARVLDVLDEPYIRTARAKGLPEWRVVGSHALRNAFAPVLTMLAMDMGTALGIAIYIETVFQLPGLGRLALSALGGESGYDLPMLLGIVVVTAVVVIVLNLLADLAGGVLDPRLREQWGRRGGVRVLRPTP